MKDERFQGFPEAGLDFLAALAENNNKSWFEAHKETFISLVQEPAQAFVVALGERLRSLSPQLNFDTRANGAGSLSRIYRDTRFSADKSPYHTYLNIVFWEGAGKKMAHPGYHFHFDADGGVMRQGIYQFDKGLLGVYRQAVLNDEKGATLATAVAQIEQAGFRMGGEHYKRVPRGFDPDHPRADFLRFNGLGAHSPQIEREAFLSGELVDICFNYCQIMSPLQSWLVQLQQG